jgi:hypothetical protein
MSDNHPDTALEATSNTIYVLNFIQIMDNAQSHTDAIKFHKNHFTQRTAINKHYREKISLHSLLGFK